jgi:hypothetical protein
VADEQDRDALLLEPPDNLEQSIDLAAGDRRGRLVHDQHARIERQGPDDLDRLTLGDAEQLDRQIDVDRRLQACEQLACMPAHRRPVDPPSPTRLASDEDVLGNRKVREHGRMLVDHRDTVTLRVARPADRDLLALEQDPAAIGLVDTAQDLDQRALAGAVLAGKRVHAPGMQAKINVAQHLDRAKPLGDAL